MPVIVEKSGGGSGATTLLTFLIGTLIVAIAVVAILHVALHII